MKLLQKIAEQLNIFGKVSQSYQGEDIILWRYFVKNNIHNGFFIDIGAYHPKFANNTWRLRNKLGFTGINIEPTYRIKFFYKYRKNDINIKCMVGDKYEVATLNYVTNEPATSGKNQNRMVQQADKKLSVIQKTLTQIVKENNVTKIDLLDIDIEGTEMEVLKGYDWSIIPRLILIEDDKDENREILSFLTSKGYKQIAHTINNALYESNV